MKFPPIPNKVKGALCLYKVTHGTQDQSNAGECITTEAGCELRVTTALPIELRWQTFLHELVHKWEAEGGFLLKDIPGDSDVDRIATAMLADFIRNNWTLPGA